MEQRMIDPEKLYEFIDRCIEQSNECAEEASGNKRYASAELYDKRAKSLAVFKDLLEDADIYADPQLEPKWHWEDIDSWEAFEEYAGQEVEVWCDGIDNKHTAILRGYIPEATYSIITDIVDNCGRAWSHGRVKVYEEN